MDTNTESKILYECLIFQEMQLHSFKDSSSLFVLALVWGFEGWSFFRKGGNNVDSVVLKGF